MDGTSTVWISVQKHVEFGQFVGVVGPCGWERGSPLAWNDGDCWRGEVPSGAEFKLAVIDSCGQILTWEDGPNRRVAESAELEGRFGRSSEVIQATTGHAADFEVLGPSGSDTALVSEIEPSFPGSFVSAEASVMRDGGDDMVPAWAASAVWYQIYPLGFFNCPSNNDHTGEIIERLSGLLPNIDHLKALGVGCVLFNPLFESDTHGYDTSDYMVGPLEVSQSAVLWSGPIICS